MRFEDFASEHGLIINRVEYGAWRRVPTSDHPHKKNGAYLHRGHVAFVQNHATMGEPCAWFPDAENSIRIDHAAIARRNAEAQRELRQARENAERKAASLLSACSLEKHAYFDAKGFPQELGNVLPSEDGCPLLCIPMMRFGRLAGLQTITVDGDKKFLFGQQSAGAQFVFDGRGRDWFCEGYATALSLRAALSALKMRYRIHVCFSAHNLARLAAACDDGIVMADNDENGAGLKAAQQSGRPYILPPVVGEDANDWHKRDGLFQFSQAIRRAMTAF